MQVQIGLRNVLDMTTLVRISNCRSVLLHFTPSQSECYHGFWKSKPKTQSDELVTPIVLPTRRGWQLWTGVLMFIFWFSSNKNHHLQNFGFLDSPKSKIR